MLEVARFGDVVRIRMSRSLLGRPLQWVHAFWVDGLLIDSGCAYTLPDLAAALEREGLTVEQLVNTHTHEDHISGNGWLHRRFGVTPRAHPLALPRLAEAERGIQLYRHIFWGQNPEGCQGEPLSATVETDRHRFQVIHTPGHAPDHVAFWEAQRGWLFTGDLMISPRLERVRAEEEPITALDSLRWLAALPVRQLFCSHAYRVSEDASPLREKIAYWDSIRREGERLRASGLRPEQVADRLAGPERLATWLTQGDYSKRHLVTGLIRGA